MANKYWVEGSGTWDSSSTTHWASTSGGASGETAPTSSDNVFFDLHSNDCYNLDISFTGTTKVTIANGTSGSISIYGSLDMSGGTDQINWTFSGITSFKTTTSCNINMNGIAFASNGYVYLQGTGTYTLTSNFEMANFRKIELKSGTLNCGTYNFKAGGLKLDSGTKIYLGSGTHTCLLEKFGFTVLDINSEATIYPSTGTIKIFVGGSGNSTLALGGHTYNNIWIYGENTSGIKITGNNTFNNFKDTGSEAHVIQFPTGNTIIKSLTVNGSSGKLITLQNTDGTTHATLLKSGVGIIDNCDYINANYLTGSPDDVWYLGVNSTDSVGGSLTNMFLTDAPEINIEQSFFNII